MPTAAVNETELYYLEQGSGPSLLLVHGSLNDARTWSAQTAPFAEFYRVVALSRRHHFPNRVPPGVPAYSVDEQARDLAAFIEALQLAPAHIVCSSYGGCVALLMATQHPGLARSLVLSEPPLIPWLRHLPGAEGLFEGQGRVMEAANRAFQSGDPQGAMALFINSVQGEGYFERLPAAARERLADDAPEFEIETRTPPELYFPPLTPRAVRGVTIPTLLLGGEKSPRMFGLVLDELGRSLPRSTRKTISRASHTMHNVNPREFNATVLEFLRHVDEPRKV